MLSFAGGAEIMIWGQRMATMPKDNLVNFYSYDDENTYAGPALTSKLHIFLF